MQPLNRQIELMNKARASATFSTRDLTVIIYGGEEAVRLREVVLNRVEAKLQLGDQMTLPRAYAEGGRSEIYKQGLEWGRVLMEEQIQHDHGIFDVANHQYALLNASPFGLHPTMFLPTIRMQGTTEQQAYWLPLAESGRIIGTYAQTELGHGSFVRGLETLATLDTKTDEFIIHSPTVTSAKYWPGGLGFSSSHAIVMARLMIDAKDYGVHSFIVQLRSLEDWKPLPGIELGDLGFKMGLNTTDNGYAVFNQVRIPRVNMLMGHAQVQKDGSYSRKGATHSSYRTMLQVRCQIVHTVAFQLAQAVTIATRFSHVRTQGHGHYSEFPLEASIMTFKSQHARLLGMTAQAYAILFASKACTGAYEDLVKEQQKGRPGQLPYCHAIASGLKAYATQIAADGAEDARKCCGGHGYSALSGLPDLVALITPHCTWEGDNTVLLQQTARYLVKVAAAVRSGKPVDAPMKYLADWLAAKETPPSPRCQAHSTALLEPAVQLSLFRHRAARVIFEAEALLAESTKKERFDLGNRHAWNEHMLILLAAARAHTELYVLEAFTTYVAAIIDPAIREVMNRLRNLFALTAIVTSTGFLEDAYLSHAQFRDIRAHVNSMHKLLLPDAIALTDAWGFSNASLKSALGVWDGNVYETLMAWTRQVPINVEAAKNGGAHAGGAWSVVEGILKGEGGDVKAKL